MEGSQQSSGPEGQDRLWRFGGAEFDEERRELSVAGRPFPMEAKPLTVLAELLSHAGEVVSREALLAAAWPGLNVVPGSLPTAISKLRAAFGDEGRRVIESVHRMGYRIGVPIVLAQPPKRARLAMTLIVGDTVPNRPQWRLSRPLGDRAQPNVWLAEHEKTGEARVFKFADTGSRLDALRREAAISRLLHDALGDRPQLVRIIEWNFDARPFFIESPYGGLDLPTWAATRGGIASVGLAERLAIVAEVAEIVSDVHGLGVLHRDIKPTNILVSDRADGSLLIRLVDFGAGRLLGTAAMDAARITGLTLAGDDAAEAAFRSGTLRYMAPEVIAGGPATIAADVFALGILLYQMIVGDLDRSLGAGWEDDITDVLLREDVRQAASSAANRRLPSASVLANRLKRVDIRRAEQEERQRLESESGRLLQQLERARVRRPWLTLGVASLALGFLSTSGFAFLATRARQEAQRQSNITRQVNSFLTDDLLGRANPRVTGKPEETLVEAATSAERRIAARLPHDPIVAASLYLALAKAFDGRSDYSQARVDYQRAAAAYESASGRNSADVIITRLRQAQMEATASKEGSLERAKALLQQAEPFIDMLGSRSTEVRTWFYRARSSYQFWTNHTQGALQDAREGERLVRSLPDIFDQDDVNEVRLVQASAFIRLARWDEAQAIVADVLSSDLAIHGSFYPDTLISQRRMAQILIARGRPADAIPLLDAAYPKLAHVFGDEHRETQMAVSLRGEALNEVGRYGDATRDSLIAYNAAVHKDGERSFMAIAALDDLADNQCRVGQVQAGLESAQRAYNNARAVYGERGAISQLVGVMIAQCLIASKRYDAARPFVSGLNVAAVSVQNSDPDTDAMIYLFQAEIAFADGNAPLASQLLARPRQVFRKAGADQYFKRNLADLEAGLDARKEKP